MIDKSILPEITTDKLYTSSSNLKVDQNGLLSEVIFGPIRKYRCSCGELSSKSIHNGETCPKCGVKCENNIIRYSKFAKIILPFHIINTINKNKFNRITKREFKSFLNPNTYDLISSLNIYLEYNLTTGSIQLTSNFNPNCLPLKLTGIYSLYLALTALAIVYNSESAKEYLSYFYNDLLVLPPECRLVLNTTEKSRNIIKHKVVDVYLNILRIKQYVLKDNTTIDDDFTEHLNGLLSKMQSGDYDILEDSKITMYDSLAGKFQYYADVLYEEVLILLSGKNGIIRSDFLGKNIDFSSRAVVINDPSLAAHQIKVPKDTFFKLWFVEYYRYYSKHYKSSNSRFYDQHITRLMKPIENSLLHIDYSKEYPEFDNFVEWFLNNSSIEQRLIYINRQPTLWRYGLLGVEIVGINNENIISVSPLIIPSLAMDFDGDTAGLYKVHDNRSMNELYNNSFVMNLITYDHNDSLLLELSNESRYIYEVLRSSIIDEQLEKISIDKINHLQYDYKIHLNSPTHIRSTNTTIPYGIAILNKFADFKDIVITNSTDSNEALKSIFKNSLSNERFQLSVKAFLQNLYWVLTTHQSETLTLPFIESGEFVNKVKHNKLISKLPQNPYLGSYIYNGIVDNIYDNIPKSYQLYKLTKSKFKKTQFSRSLISIGYIADNHNMISPYPVKNNIITGLTEDEFFETSFGTRKGIVDKDENVPDAGYMQRSMVINLSTLEIVEDDCKTDYGFLITIQNKTHNKSMINRYFIDDHDNNLLHLYDESYALNDNNIGKTFRFRSPMSCQTDNFKVCSKCVGKQKFKSPFIGLMAGQYIEERLTQLTMSSFHTSGSATIILDPELKEYFQYNIADVNEHDEFIIVKFKSSVDQDKLKKIINIPEFKFVKQLTDCELMFEKYKYKLENEDVGKIIKKVNSILATQLKNTLIPIETAYYETLDALHQVSSIYSVFVELLFANSYVNKDNKIIRYALRDKESPIICKKYNTKQLHKLQSNTLSLIYEPNKQSILNYYNNSGLDKSSSNLSIFEKIWKGQI